MQKIEDEIMRREKGPKKKREEKTTLTKIVCYTHFG